MKTFQEKTNQLLSLQGVELGGIQKGCREFISDIQHKGFRPMKHVSGFIKLVKIPN